ncbi:MAG: hypothetical protein HY791_02310 [Deltaproteobacteria bacterium]|nr:hypothetical protein [Deltaproteobacteria bacterium]
MVLQKSLIAALVMASSLTTGGIAAAQTRPRLLAPQLKEAGKTYEQWSAEWWQWAMKIPAATNPVLDSTGANCGVGQKGPVWFLAGTFGTTETRSCNIPINKFLFFPLLNLVWFNTQNDPQAWTITGLQDHIRPYITQGTVTMELDGKSYTNEELAPFLTESPAFLCRFDETDPVLGVTPAKCPAGGDGTLHCHPCASSGWFVMVRPLSPGDHTLRFTGTLPWFSTSVTYNLHVGP